MQPNLLTLSPWGDKKKLIVFVWVKKRLIRKPDSRPKLKKYTKEEQDS